MNPAASLEPPPPPFPVRLPSKSERRRESARLLPCRVGRYTLLDYIGHGGMADIYLARVESSLGASRLVVFKEVHPELAEDARFAEMLIAEAKLAARLTHANIVKVEDLGRETGTLYVAMEYVEGIDLREMLRRAAVEKIPVPIEFSLFIVMEVLRALDYAHRAKDEFGRPLGVVHRDVSPSNVLLSFEGEVKLCDFGIARATSVSPIEPDEAIAGKAGYMSPEQARGELIDGRADVFSVGIMLWEMLSGRKLYKAGPGERLIDVARRAESPPSLPSLGLPHEDRLFDIVSLALLPDLEDRHASAAAMLRDLENYVAEAGIVPSPIRFGEWLMQHFGMNIVSMRRAKERAMRALERGPAAVLTPITPPKDKPKKETKGGNGKGARRKSLLPPAAPLPAPPPKAPSAGVPGAILMLAATMVAVLVMLAMGAPPQ